MRAGVRLGPYEIVAPIGAGGMGEVYKASDTRLGRTVAIKILPAEFSNDAKLKIRFEREAKTISALNHPHICTLHDVGRHNGTDYLVMEYCEGITLADRLAHRKKFSIEETLEYGAQIADALDKAHQHGVIHRDLKPSNVMLTKSGVKLLDFGLARQQQASASTNSTSTLQQPLSEEGKIVGTLQYIAPETLTGEDADVRSDIYALGLILHEMIRGAPAFAEDSRAKLIAAILEHEPPPLPAGPEVTPQLKHIVSRCLRKKPDERWQSAADVAAELRWLAEQRGAESTGSHRGLRHRSVSLLVLIAALIAAAGVYYLRLKSSTSAPVKRSVVAVMVEDAPLVLQADLVRRGVPPMAIAAEGQAVAYIAGDPQRLYVRPLAAQQGRLLSGTEGAAYPFFSPDGSSIGFVSGGKLRRLSLAGGAPQIICDSPGEFRMPNWGEDGRIYFRRDGAICAVPASGGIPVHVTRPASDEMHSHPSLLPGGKKLLFDISFKSRDWNNRTFATLDLATGAISRIFTGGSQPRFSRSGHLLFARCGPSNQRTATIFSVEFDLKSGRVSGAPVPRVTDVEAWPTVGIGYWEAAANGTVVYVPHDPAFIQRELVWLDRQGVPKAAANNVGYITGPRLSPDGTRVAFDDLTSIWITDLVRDISMPVVESQDFAQNAIWSPDGRQIAFESFRAGGQHGLYVAPIDGSAPPKSLVISDGSLFPQSWSHDGTMISYTRQGTKPGETWDLWSVDPSSGKTKPLVVASGTQQMPVLSPDGHWLAFVLLHNNQFDIHVQNLVNGTRYVALAGAPCGGVGQCYANLLWSRDGRELFFKSVNRVMALEVNTSRGVFQAGKPRVLFEAESQGGFDVAPDGKRFIASQFKRRPRWDHLNLVSGWWID